MTQQMTRRAMLAGTAASAAVLAGCKTQGHHHHHDHAAAPASPSITLPDNATILLQGDSITDAGRAKMMLDANNQQALGRGYAHLIAYHLLAKYPEKNLQVYNRGISGNKVPDLDARWDRDCIDLAPDILSIMIGVNDYWHTVAFGSNYDGTVESYGTGLTALLERTKEALPDVQLVICEPFVVRAADGSTRSDWFPEFDERRAKCREAAESVDAVYVEFQSMFDQAVAAGTSHEHWSGDNIHVNPNGAALMAMRWLGDTGLG